MVFTGRPNFLTWYKVLMQDAYQRAFGYLSVRRLHNRENIKICGQSHTSKCQSPLCQKNGTNIKDNQIVLSICCSLIRYVKTIKLCTSDFEYPIGYAHNVSSCDCMILN